jgi:undecaprenyl diphosphate synthase
MASTTTVRHVACIMDGNGRWAGARGLERVHGHLASMPSLEAIVAAALAEGVPWLTLFAFSTENWSRPAGEVRFLMGTLANRIIDRSLSRLHEQGVRVRILGAEEGRLPDDLMAKIRHAERLTQGNDKLQLTLAVDYGGRGDLVHAARALAAAGTPADDITPELFAAHLQDPDLPDVDLLIRPGGEQRLSNFLLWHCAYAELVFLDVLWPDFRAEHFRHALRVYHQRQRRFGNITADHAQSRTGDPAWATDSLDVGGATSGPLAALRLASVVRPRLPEVPKAFTLPAVVALHLTGELLGSVRSTMRAASVHLGTTPPPHRPDS